MAAYRASHVHVSLMALVGLLSWSDPDAIAQSTPPIISQSIRSDLPIYNQFGKILMGNEPGREALGLDHVRGNRVEILAAPDGIIYPPLKDGQNDPRNPLLDVTYIGYGIDPLIETPGTFSTTLTPRPADGSKIFARAFNMPSRELTSFYADSQLFTVSWAVDTPFIANFPHTTNPLDPDDDDNDGLNNSWERWNGSNPGRVDTDGDGFDDQSEFLAGTDPDDWESYLQIVGMSVSNNVVIMDYASGRNNRAKIEISTNLNTFTVQDPINSETNTTQGIVSVELPAASAPTSILRLGVPVNEF